MCREGFFSESELLDGFYLRGHLKLWRGHINDSMKDLMQGLSIESEDHYNSAFFLTMIYITSGRGDSARPIIQRILRIDPLNPWSYLISGGAGNIF